MVRVEPLLVLVSQLTVDEAFILHIDPYERLGTKGVKPSRLPKKHWCRVSANRKRRGRENDRRRESMGLEGRRKYSG